MTEIVDLPEITTVDDTDLFMVFDVSAPSDKSSRSTKANALKEFVRTTGTFAVGTLDATGALNAPAGAIDALTVASGLTIGAEITKVLVGSASVLMPDAPTLTQVSATMAVTDAIVGDAVIVAAASTLPAGMILRAVVTAPDVVTIYAFNATGSTITTASHAIKLILIRAT